MPLKSLPYIFGLVCIIFFISFFGMNKFRVYLKNNLKEEDHNIYFVIFYAVYIFLIGCFFYDFFISKKRDVCFLIYYNIFFFLYISFVLSLGLQIKVTMYSPLKNILLNYVMLFCNMIVFAFISYFISKNTGDVKFIKDDIVDPIIGYDMLNGLYVIFILSLGSELFERIKEAVEKYKEN